MKINFLHLVKNPYTWLGFIVVIGFVVRLYKIDNPIADWHSWRQADTAAVARNFFQDGYNPFLPKYDDMSGVAEHPVPNPGRYRFVEFPIYNSIVYFAYLLNSGVDEKLARLINVFFSLGSIFFIFFIAKKYFGNLTAFLSSLLFAILPYNIYFSRVILPEPSLIFFCLGMFYFTDCWIQKNTTKLYSLSLIFTLFAFLTKPTAVFYLLPLVYSYYQKEKKWWPIPKRYFKLFIPALLPFLFWRIWINQHPEGIPASKWLLNGNGIRFKPVFWKWILQDRLGREILAATGSVLFFIGALKRPSPKQGWFLHIFLLSSFLYLIIFATGNVQHDYYQALIIPALVIFTARGFILLWGGISDFLPRIWTIPLSILFLFMTIYLGWGEVKGLYQINNPAIVEAGKKADEILPKNAVVLAPYNGDSSFLYQTNRSGWPVVAFPIPEMIEKFGVSAYVSTAKDAKTKWVMRRFVVLVDNPNYVIVDLTRENPGFDYKYDKEPN